MHTETDCPSCRGTGTLPVLWPPLYQRKPDDDAHPYTVICGCGVFADSPAVSELNNPPGTLLAGNLHVLALARSAGYVAWVDERLVADIELLWANGIETISSCQGDGGRYPDRIIHVRPIASASLVRRLLPWVTNVQERSYSDVAVLSAPWSATFA